MLSRDGGMQLSVILLQNTPIPIQTAAGTIPDLTQIAAGTILNLMQTTAGAIVNLSQTVAVAISDPMQTKAGVHLVSKRALKASERGCLA